MLNSGESDPAETAPDAARPPIALELHCPHCTYNLHGLTGDRCPECGLPLDFVDSPESRIAWVHRRQRGRIRSYVKTVLAVTFRHTRASREIFRPMDYGDAQRFRWVTVALVTLTLIGGSLEYVVRPLPARITTPPGFAAMYLPEKPPDKSILRDGLDELGLSPVIAAGVAMVVGLFLTVVVITGIPSYFFHPRQITVEPQNRAIALSHYASAPLALLPLLLLLLRVLRLWEPWQELPWQVYGVFDGAATVLILILYWRTLVASARRALPHTSVAWRVAGLVPLLWIIVGVLTLVAAPALVVYLWLVFDTFI